MSKENLALILGVIGVLLVIDGAISLARFVVSLCKRKKTIIITSEGLEVLKEALALSELSWCNLLTDNPEACNDDEAQQRIAKIRKLRSDFISAFFKLHHLLSSKFLNRTCAARLVVASINKTTSTAITPIT